MATIFQLTKIFKSFDFGEWLKFMPVFITADFFCTD